MSKIDFIGIGAPKCGTTWLSAQLAAHPQIGFAPDKELYYFADTILRRLAGQELRCFEKGDAWYHEQFPAAGGAVSCRGEFCPSYLYSEEAAERIAAYRPDIKLLLCLRPPVEMIYSWYWYNRNAVVASLPKSFAEMMENPFLRDLGCFARHLKPYLDRFPAKNFLVIQFDAIRRDPDQVRHRFSRLYVPRNDGRRLRLNALVAAGNVGGDGEREAVADCLDDPDETTRELAAWALARMDGRDA